MNNHFSYAAIIAALATLGFNLGRWIPRFNVDSLPTVRESLVAFIVVFIGGLGIFEVKKRRKK